MLLSRHLLQLEMEGRIRAPFTSRRNASSVQLGDEDLPQGPTTHWKTEYDCEFANKLGLSIDKYLPAQRPGPATPRSLKRGFVHYQDYQKLDDKYNSQKMLAEDLRTQLVTTSHMMQSWQKDESALMEAFTQEHELLGLTGQQLKQAVGSMQSLLALVERNQEMMGIISKGHGIQGPVRQTGTEASPKQSTNSPPRVPIPVAGDDADNRSEHDLYPDDYAAEHGQQRRADNAVLKEKLGHMESELAALVQTVKHLASTAAHQEGGSRHPDAQGSAHSRGLKGKSRFVERIETYPKHKPGQAAKMTAWRPWT